MPTVKLIQDQEASPEVQGMFKHLEEDKGMVPPTFRALANFPAYMKATLEKMQVAMAPGKLDAKTKFFIALTTSINNGSDMCITSHTQQLKKMGVSEEELLEMIAVIDASTGMNRVNTGLRIFPQA
ncbi:peroxiredoxin [Acididesulfobacillus acetoxydans]|uniref:Alkylhydroperoxidase AhpD core domain protein n=1 Tax=Acididesulfobacillus acetoxydans TaxID=1561005 RepID=A0A8S0Y323_9FIRM|nr:carboxymuconolactone decarboxylase family protein [Acididesulfobacillus acetoxydans]CAA7601515.1 peroxiredoxin [Acididesulfobacillus acetoxydans]CEJ07002.1 Alkylhydroperoxidase AhpD core domain protein [Acididesulfobacillus acetoxydans]